VLLRAPRITAAANGVRTLINSILDHSLVAQQPALVGVLVFLLDSPDTRQLVRANDVALLLAPLCATYRGRDQLSDEERVLWRASLHSIVLLARSWAGLIGMSSGPVGLKAAVAALALPIGDLHDDVINAFFRIFRPQPAALGRHVQHRDADSRVPARAHRPRRRARRGALLPHRAAARVRRRRRPHGAGGVCEPQARSGAPARTRWCGARRRSCSPSCSRSPATICRAPSACGSI
jgi:hypothetical protein